MGKSHDDTHGHAMISTRRAQGIQSSLLTERELLLSSY
jgi:hypothetical protein